MRFKEERLTESYQHFPTFLEFFYRNHAKKTHQKNKNKNTAVETMWKLCGNTVKPLWKHRGNIAETMREHRFGPIWVNFRPFGLHFSSFGAPFGLHFEGPRTENLISPFGLNFGLHLASILDPFGYIFEFFCMYFHNVFEYVF